MGHHQDLQRTTKGSKEKQSPKLGPSCYEGMTPPPSYQSCDGLLADEATRPGVSLGQELQNRTREQGTMPRQHNRRTEELIINHRSRDDCRKRHPYHGSSSSHKDHWTAKLVFQGLKSNLFGSCNTGQSSGQRQGRRPASRVTWIDISNNGDNHYTIHNHWHEMTLSGHFSRTKSWRGDEPAGHIPRPFPNFPSGALPPFRFDAHYADHKAARWPWCQDHPISCEETTSSFSPYQSDELERSSLWEKVFGHEPCYTSHGAASPHQPQDPWWSGQSTAEQEWADGTTQAWHRHGLRFATDHDTTWPTSFDRRGSSGQVRGSGGPMDCAARSSAPWTSEHGTPNTTSSLTDYNKRWDYIDTVQQPYPYEIPWPRVRPDASFDHMKCDVFSFFANGHGLEPDRSKAPKLDFKLSPRSPYPSYDQRQQDCERKMLKKFKQQMQKEKLRWHEDKLRRKFPNVVGRGWEDERRKAVWAAIAEGSAICDKRLANML